MQIGFTLTTAAQRAFNTIVVAQVIIQGATICAQLCMLNLHSSVTDVIERGFAVGILV